MDAGSQGLGPFSIALPGHKQGAGWEVELPGLEPAPIQDPGVFKERALATRPQCTNILTAELGKSYQDTSGIDIISKYKM